MSREQQILAAFIDFADTLVDDYDVVEFLHRLATCCAGVIEAADVGIMLAEPEGGLRYVASSSERMRVIEVLELQHDQGPCPDAYSSGSALFAVVDEDAIARWPRFAPSARAVGFESVSALPMRLRNEVIGVLNIFSSTPAPLRPHEQDVVQALADVATIGILQARALRDARDVAAQLEAALTSRIVIEQAKGIVAERSNISIDDAFAILRNYSRSQSRLMSAIARDVIDGSLSIDVLLA